jgi:hypothetical protein
MTKLKMDNVSAKTLPYLDSLVKNQDKLDEVLNQTEGASLNRLVLAAISRNIVPAGGEVSEEYIVAAFLERTIVENLQGDDENLLAVLESVNDSAKRMILSLSINRFITYDQPRQYRF